MGPLLEFLTLSSFGGPRGHNGDGSGAAVGAVLPVSCVYTGTDCLKEELQELPFHAKLLAGHHRARPSPASGAPTALRRDAQAAHPAPAEVPAAAARRVSASCVDDHPLSALRRTLRRSSSATFPPRLPCERLPSLQQPRPVRVVRLSPRDHPPHLLLRHSPATRGEPIRKIEFPPRQLRVSMR